MTNGGRILVKDCHASLAMIHGGGEGQGVRNEAGFRLHRLAKGVKSAKLVNQFET